jgi:hypothetical protein
MRAYVLSDDNCVLVKHFDPFKVFDYKSATRLDVDQQKNMVCTHLNSMGYNVDSLVQRLSKQTSEEERIMSLAKSGISLSSIFFAVGSSCLSTDDILYKKKVEVWEMECKERDKVRIENKLHAKGL